MHWNHFFHYTGCIFDNLLVFNYHYYFFMWLIQYLGSHGSASKFAWGLLSLSRIFQSLLTHLLGEPNVCAIRVRVSFNKVLLDITQTIFYIFSAVELLVTSLIIFLTLSASGSLSERCKEVWKPLQMCTVIEVFSCNGRFLHTPTGSINTKQDKCFKSHPLCLHS